MNDDEEKHLQFHPQPDVTYVDHPMHPPIRHAPIATAAHLVHAARAELQERHASKETLDELQALGDKWGAHPFTNSEVQFLAEFVMLMMRQSS